MGQAKRTGKQRRQEILAGATQMHVEGQGVWHVDIISRDALPALLNAPTEQTQKTVMMLAQAIRTMKSMQPRPMCLLCDHRFINDAPAAFVLLSAAIDVPSQGIANGLCAACASQDDLQGRIAEKYKDMLLTDLRVLPTPAEPGRA